MIKLSALQGQRMTEVQKKALSKYRPRLKKQGVALVCAVARDRHGASPVCGSKALLAEAPLDGIDLTRAREPSIHDKPSTSADLE